MLGSQGSSGEGPYVTWVKEGRKYDLGSVMITQQPGSIPQEILSQGDNWFVFHLLSAGDLAAVKRANAHFSDDILSALLNEPIPGQGVFWSSAGGKSYPVSLRVLSFEQMYRAADPAADRPEARTAASVLRTELKSGLGLSMTAGDGSGPHPARRPTPAEATNPDGPEVPQNLRERQIAAAVAKLKEDHTLMQRLRTDGVRWGWLFAVIRDCLPRMLHNREQIVRDHMDDVLVKLLGPKGQAWTTEERPSAEGDRPVWWVVPGQRRTADGNGGSSS